MADIPFQLADNMVREIEEGIGETGVRCGVIGEIGCSYPLMDSEKKALQAAAMAQTRTGEEREEERKVRGKGGRLVHKEFLILELLNC